jgi:hypothetical protein
MWVGETIADVIATRWPGCSWLTDGALPLAFC